MLSLPDGDIHSESDTEVHDWSTDQADKRMWAEQYQQ
jgi:hypothetical protein